MIRLPATGLVCKTSIRRDEKQGRAFEGGGAVRVFGENNFFIKRLDCSRDLIEIRRLLDAPNAVEVRTHSGRLVGIRLLAFADDRGHSGEHHGSSIVSTERVRNDYGSFVGSDKTLKHKLENVNHATPAPAWSVEAPRSGPIRPPLDGT